MALVSDGMIEDDCLLVFMLWRDSPRARAWHYCFSERPAKQGLLLNFSRCIMALYIRIIIIIIN